VRRVGFFQSIYHFDGIYLTIVCERIKKTASCERDCTRNSDVVFESVLCVWQEPRRLQLSANVFSAIAGLDRSEVYVECIQRNRFSCTLYCRVFFSIVGSLFYR